MGKIIEYSVVKQPRRDLGIDIILNETHINPLALELDIYSLAHHLCKM